MELLLEILDGEKSGTRVKIREGLVIGRKEGSIIVNDSKISVRHAAVKIKSGKYFLVDLGSSNQIKAKAGRVRELELTAEVEFTLGRTRFLVVEADSKANTAESSEPVYPKGFIHEPAAEAIEEPTLTRSGYQPDLGEFTPTATPLKPRVEWQKHVKAALAQGVEGGAVKRDIAPIHPVLRLRFIRGIQTGTEWTVGYGPRAVGSNVVDLTLEDTSLPSLCFRLLPENGGVTFQNETEKEVRLNGRWVESDMLKSGDIIEIGNTQIEVKFG